MSVRVSGTDRLLGSQLELGLGLGVWVYSGWVCGCGCVGSRVVWVYGCMGVVWVFGCMDVWVWVYRCMRVWVGVGVVGVWMCVHMGVPVNCVCE